MPVPTLITDLDSTASLNSPAGTEYPKGAIDDYLRAHASFIRQNYDTATGHIADTSAAHAATAIAFTPAGTIAATTVQAAIEELAGDVSGISLAASGISNTPAGNIAATDVQAAINELDTEKQAAAAELSAIAGLTSAANKIPMFSGSGTATLIDFKDEDDFASNSATAVPSQQSTKAYVDTAVSASGAVKRVEHVVFAANGTWTKDANLLFVIVEVIGGGGGADTDSTTTCGGSGGYSRKYIAAASLGATETVTRGAAGATAGSPSAGGTSSFGSHCSATGGAAGGATTSGDAGEGSGGDVNSTKNTDSSGGGTYGFGCGGTMPDDTNATAGVVIVTEYYSA